MLVTHLQHLYHLLPMTHITMTIFTQPTLSNLRPLLQPFTKANTHGTAPTTLKHMPNPLTISAVASSQQNSLILLFNLPTYPMFSLVTYCHSNMSKPPFLGVPPMDIIKLSTSPPHKTQPTAQNTSSHETHKKTTTTTDVERTHHLQLPSDWHELPRPPELIPTSNNKLSLHATYPKMMMMTTTTTMTPTADVELTQHSKIPYDWNEHSKISYDWTEFPRPTEMTYSTKPYLPHTDIYCTANLRPNSVPPQPHRKNTTRTTQHATTTDHHKLAQQAFYHKANLRPP